MACVAGRAVCVDGEDEVALKPAEVEKGRVRRLQRSESGKRLNHSMGLRKWNARQHRVLVR